MKHQSNTAETDQHPLSGKVISGAETVVQVLADEGVDTVFGYSGGAILPIYDAVFRHNKKDVQNKASQPMRLVVPANEQGAGFMAAGYARASGKVGVVMVTSGPGATNTVTPVRDSMADSVPLVVICGQVPTAAIGTDAFQEAPVHRYHGCGREARFPRYGPVACSKTPCAAPLSWQEPAVPARSWSISRKMYKTGKAT